MTEDVVTPSVASAPTGPRLIAWLRTMAPLMRWVLVAVFVGAGGAKLAGLFSTVTLFAMVGVGQWFRYAVGCYELVAAALLAYRKTTVIGTLALIALMLGAVATEVLILARPPLSSGAKLLGLLLVLVGRRGGHDPRPRADRTSSRDLGGATD